MLFRKNKSYFWFKLNEWICNTFFVNEKCFFFFFYLFDMRHFFYYHLVFLDSCTKDIVVTWEHCDCSHLHCCFEWSTYFTSFIYTNQTVSDRRNFNSNGYNLIIWNQIIYFKWLLNLITFGIFLILLTYWNFFQKSGSKVILWDSF